MENFFYKIVYIYENLAASKSVAMNIINKVLII